MSEEDAMYDEIQALRTKLCEAMEEASRYAKLVEDVQAWNESLLDAVGSCRRAIYEIEGGNRWPVDWSSDKMHGHIQAAKGTLNKIGFPVPEWQKNPPGWKREDLKPAKACLPAPGGSK